MEYSQTKTSAGYSFTALLKIPNLPGCLAGILKKIADLGGSMSEVSLKTKNFNFTEREVTIHAHDEEHANSLIHALKHMEGVSMLTWRDDTFTVHDGGKLRVQATNPINSIDDLSRAYSPGVARVCTRIYKNPESVFEHSIKKNSVAVISDGSAVLGLGNIGAAAAMPVMEGKAVLLKQFANIDGYPICLATQDTEEIINIVKNISVGFGGINLEDISAPRCFEIETRLQQELDIPVFHDDQHGTAIVVLAGIINSLKIIGKKISDLRVVVNGFGASGVAITKILIQAGVKDVIPCDTSGIVYQGRPKGMNPIKDELAKITNKDKISGDLAKAMVGADVFVGGLVTRKMVASMNKDCIVFALANPIPEVFPHEINDIARIVAAGRSDFANQVNNVLAFPGMFRGALNARATKITENMKLAASYAIADFVSKDELCEQKIIPNCFEPGIVDKVASAVAEAAIKDNVCRKTPQIEQEAEMQLVSNG
jgi:malate dehydrogenase (oxaloacetate-decarboxylating)